MDSDSPQELSEVKSSAYPTLERVPGKQNWVDHAGGLPKYIERIAKHLHYEKGFPIGTAIAIAVNTVKRWATAGAVTKTGKGAGHQVTAATRAKAAKAVAQWEAKKAKGKAKAVAEAAVEDEDVDRLTEAELLEVAAEPADPAADVAKYLSRNFGHSKEMAAKLVAATLYEGQGPHMSPEEQGSVTARLENRLNLLEGVALSLAGDDERARSLAVANGYQLLSPGTKAVKLNEVAAADEADVRALFAQMAPEMEGLREALDGLSESKLSAEARKNLSPGDFVFPDERRYPIHDENHARSALSMVARHGSDDEKAKVRAAVKAKYPDIGLEEADTVADLPQTMFRGKGRCEDCGHKISVHDANGKCADCEKGGTYRAYEAQESLEIAEGCGCWKGYCRVPGTKPCAPGSCKKCDAKRVKADLSEAMRGQRAKGSLPKENPDAEKPADAISAEAKEHADATTERVKHLQARLDSLGFETKADGVFGPKTEGRVREFQLHAGLAQDGVVGKITTSALRLAPSPDEMVAVAATPGLVPQTAVPAPEAVDPRDAENALKPTGDSTGQEKETKAKVEEGLADGFGSETEMGPTLMPDDLNLMNPVQPVEVPPKEKKRSKPKPPPAMFKGVGVGETRSNPHVKELQGDLKKVGYNVVEDGRFGPETEQATKRFQRKYGLAADGVVGPKTLRTVKGVKKHLAEIDEAGMDQELAGDASEWQDARDRLVALKRRLAEAEKLGESAWPELEISEAPATAVRGAARKAVQIKRLPDGTFAPKGLGQILRPGDEVEFADGPKEGEKGIVSAAGSVNKVEITTGPRAGDEVRLADNAAEPTPPLGPLSKADLDFLPIDSDTDVNGKVWTKVESPDHQFRQLNGKNHSAGYWQSEDGEKMSSEELALASSKDFFTDPDDLPNPPASPGTKKDFEAEARQALEDAGAFDSSRDAFDFWEIELGGGWTAVPVGGSERGEDNMFSLHDPSGEPVDDRFGGDGIGTANQMVGIYANARRQTETEPPQSPGTLDLSNTGPQGKLRNVKAMGIAKLEALSNHPDVEPALKVRVDEQLKAKGHPELIGMDVVEPEPNEPKTKKFSAEPTGLLPEDKEEMTSPDDVEKAIKDSIDGKKPKKAAAKPKPPKDGATMQKAIYKKTPLMPVGATLSTDKFGDEKIVWTKTGDDEWTRADTDEKIKNADFTGGGTKWAYSESGADAPETDAPEASPASPADESGLIDNIGPDAKQIKDLQPGQRFMLSNGEEYEYHKPAKEPWHIIKPVGWSEDNDLKAKPMHGELPPPKIAPLPGEEPKMPTPDESANPEDMADDTQGFDEGKVDAIFSQYQKVKDGDATPETKAELDKLWTDIVKEMSKEDPAVGTQMESVPPHDNDPKWQDVKPKKSAKDKALEMYVAAGGDDPEVISALQVAEAAGCDFEAALRLVEAFSEQAHPRAGKGQPGGGRFVAAGSSGQPVKRVQKELGDKETGKWDDKLTSAVKAYQKQHGLLVDGIVGAQTWASFQGKKAAPGALPAGWDKVGKQKAKKKLKPGKVYINDEAR